MDIGFEGRTVLVTGAAHGFGQAIAEGFAARGARVFVCDVEEAGLAQTCERIGGGAQGTVVDVTDPVAVGKDAHARREQRGDHGEEPDDAGRHLRLDDVPARAGAVFRDPSAEKKHPVKEEEEEYG